ncbi:MAG TPA: rhodanese-like domain-containing protein [Inquilinus sp.]|nr:rhodanese-like domain-containing protein [Inquilinus sp.]
MQQEEIDVATLAEWRRDGTGHCVVDVREPQELAACRLDGTIDIPMAEIPVRLEEIPGDRPVVVMCHHGGRSAQVVRWLSARGMDNVVNLRGGIDAWAREVDPTMGRY